MHLGTKFCYHLPHTKGFWKLSVCGLKMLDFVSKIWGFSLCSCRWPSLELLLVVLGFVDSFSCQNTDFSVSSCRASNSQGFHDHYSGASHRHSGLLIALAERKMLLSPLFECCSEQRDERLSGPWHNGSWFQSAPACWELLGAVDEQLMWRYCCWLIAHARQPLLQLPLSFLMLCSLAKCCL